MASGLGSELYTLATSFDPYGAYKEGARQPAQEELKDIATVEAVKDARAEQAQSLGQMTGGQQPLAKMTNQLIPGATLYDKNGMPTVAGQMSDMLGNALKLSKQGQQMVRLAATIKDPVQQAQVMAEGRRLVQNAQQDSQKAQQLRQSTINDSIYAAATAQNPQEWDNALKAYQASGLPLPPDLPTEYSPENVKKIAALAPAALQSRINGDIIKREQEAMRLRLEQQKLRKEIAADQNGSGSSKVYDTLEEKVADPQYGVAKGKVPAKEQTVARRITTDSKEVTQGIDQVMTLTEGGMRNTTGTTFANVKDNGLLTAPVKFFTNKISDKDSQMYDAMMYPLVKGLALYTNPDYRPTDNDVKIAMNAYKAQSGQPQVVQLEKLAELKKNYLSAAESFLDSNILNAQQANSLKQQIRYVEKAIPWSVNDVVGFTRQKDYKDFKGYLSSRGELPADKSEKKSETKPSEPQTVTSQEQYDALPSGAIYIEDGKKFKKP